MIWTVLGALGAACFFSRFLIQWLASERAKRSVSPRSFWWFSLAGSVLQGATALAEREWVLVPGFLVNGSIYVRNLVLQQRPSSSRLGPVPAATLGLLAGLALIALRGGTSEDGAGSASWILLAGVLGQVVWSVRFLVQWYFTERRGYSFFPLSFWWITLAGAAFNLIYTASLVESSGASRLVFFVSYLPTPLYPIRNLMLEYGRRRGGVQDTSSGEATAHSGAGPGFSAETGKPPRND